MSPKQSASLEGAPSLASPLPAPYLDRGLGDVTGMFKIVKVIGPVHFADEHHVFPELRFDLGGDFDGLRIALEPLLVGSEIDDLPHLVQRVVLGFELKRALAGLSANFVRVGIVGPHGNNHLEEPHEDVDVPVNQPLLFGLLRVCGNPAAGGTQGEEVPNGGNRGSAVTVGDPRPLLGSAPRLQPERLDLHGRTLQLDELLAGDQPLGFPGSLQQVRRCLRDQDLVGR